MARSKWGKKQRLSGKVGKGKARVRKKERKRENNNVFKNL